MNRAGNLWKYIHFRKWKRSAVKTTLSSGIAIVIKGTSHIWDVLSLSKKLGSSLLNWYNRSRRENADREKAIERDVLEMMCTGLLVPQEHLLRKIDAAVDFNRIYDIVGDLYCKDIGRPSIDPVVLFKILLIQHLYGIRSLRQPVTEVAMNIVYRWFLGYRVSEPIPHFATVSCNFMHRFNESTIEQIFAWILEEVEA